MKLEDIPRKGEILHYQGVKPFQGSSESPDEI